jgi:nicotinamide-nucleotide amidase
MRTELIFTGTELLCGEIMNTHAQYLGQRLAALGLEPVLHTTVGDQRDMLANVISQALSRSDLIIITGGLGPTNDDLTKDVVADVLGLPLVLDESSLGRIREFFQQRGEQMPEVMLKQAYFPAGSMLLPSPRGTAPGIILEKKGRFLLLLPGPPDELRAIFEDSGELFLGRLGIRGMAGRSKTFKVTGISEAMVQNCLKDLGRQGNPGITYLAKPGEVQIRITARDTKPEKAENMVVELAGKVWERIADFIFSTDEEELEKVVAKLLLENYLTIALAESCTGGLIAARLTGVPGSSAYFLGSVVAYDNRVKERVLGVPREIIENYGAVSAPTAIAMAKGARNRLKTNLGLGVTGIAGPAGGTKEKPVGLVYLALVDTDDRVFCRQFIFPGERSGVRWGASNVGLQMIKNYCQKL